MLFIKGSTINEELGLNMRGIMNEECALAAAVGVYNPSFIVHKCLLAMENRGEAGVGIVSRNGDEFFQVKKIGSVSTQFNDLREDDFARKLPGRIAIGHNRYATKGNESLDNIQPLVIEKSKYGPFAITHNGTFVNTKEIEGELINNGAIFQSTTDTELFAHLITHSGEATMEKAIEYALKRIETTYALLIMTQDKLFAIKDRYGVRPLSIARFKKGYLICSEDHVFNSIPGAELMYEIEPGEMVIFSKGKKGIKRKQYSKSDEHFCIFEAIYFSNPRSRYEGHYHEDFRIETGIQIAIEMRKKGLDIQGDYVIPILDSGKHAAIGLAEELDIKYREFFQRTHSYGILQQRSFTATTLQEREKIVNLKLNLRGDKINDRDVIILDDSIVRSTTMKILVRKLKEAGAKKVTVCIASPPIINICPSGMDFQDTKQLIAYEKTIKGIRKIIGADELVYLSLDGLNQVIERTYNCGICSGCFGGKYPIEPQ
ncbi:MAG: amidophosphoribosyltransferase [Candidatus Pacebacteria bacterium]|nr:amidophosphoribosyltransferase [Candidatus Paceibacterota bacterium]